MDRTDAKATNVERRRKTVHGTERALLVDSVSVVLDRGALTPASDMGMTTVAATRSTTHRLTTKKLVS